MDYEEVLVSVVCATYNHSSFIRMALDGILMQITNFKIEVLIGEDCSTDNSGEILREYEKNYPDRFQVFYRKENYGAERNFKDLFAHAKGKYINILETDDFWINPYKLQKQVDYLEAHPEFVCVTHRCIVVDEHNKCLGLQYPECHRTEYTLRDYRKGLLPGQTTSLLFKNYYRNDLGFNCSIVIDPEYCKGPGDERIAFMLVTNGKVGCLKDNMSAYRYVLQGGSSFTANSKVDPAKQINYRRLFVKYAEECVKTKESVFSAEYRLLCSIAFAYLSKDFFSGCKILRNEIKKVHYPRRSTIALLLYLFQVLLKKALGLNSRFKYIDASKQEKILKRAGINFRDDSGV